MVVVVSTAPSKRGLRAPTAHVPNQLQPGWVGGASSGAGKRHHGSHGASGLEGLCLRTLCPERSLALMLHL